MVTPEYNDEEYGVGKYKFFVFNASNVKPIFKLQVQTFTHPIMLYHHDQHFDGIRTISSFMSSRYYCLHCESLYSNHDDHFMYYKAGCVNCGDHRHKKCENIDPDGRFCAGCNKTFYNDNCQRRHITNNTCIKFKKYLDCGFICNVREMNRGEHKGFVLCEILQGLLQLSFRRSVLYTTTQT